MLNQLADSYAYALFLLAKEKKCVSKYQEEVREIISIFEENEEYIKLLGSGFLSQEERKNINSNILKSVSLDIVNLFNVIIDNNRTNEILPILYSFNSYANKDKGVLEGILFSTEHLDKKIIDEICESISKKEKQKIFLINKIDKRLIGGIKVIINDHVYDGSIKHKLDTLKSNLLH